MSHFGWYYLIYLIAIFHVSRDEAYKILIYNPTFGTSHVKFLGSIADTLVSAGHEVIQLAPILFPFVNGTSSKLARTITIDADPEITNIMRIDIFAEDAWKQKQQSFFAMLRVIKRLSDALVKTCEFQLKHEKIMEEMKAAKFDLAISEFNYCFAGMIESFHIPAHVVASPTALVEHITESIGVPNIPSYIPNVFTSYTDNMSYIQRTKNLILMLFMNKLLDGVRNRCQEIFQRFYGDNFIDLKEKIAQVTYVLTNTDPLFDIPRPTIHKVMELGGLSVSNPKPLNEDWLTVVNQREAVILVSFGTVALSHMMPNEMKQMLLETFDAFANVTFIWKYEIEEHRIADGHSNVVTAKWLPQSDLLAHSKVIAFLTHGGMNSITETLNHGKPVVVIPIFGDQLQNAVLVERSGIGIKLTLPEAQKRGKLYDAIYNIITDKSYAQKAKRLSNMIAKRPNPAKEQLIKHVEFAAQFGQIANFDPYECGGAPYNGVTVELWDDDIFNFDDQLDSTHTDRSGKFQLYGETREVRSIEPYLLIRHNCDNGHHDVRCTYTDRYDVPKSYQGMTYNLGKVDLKSATVKRKTKCY
uniref:glucuronosyltransferase n=1 Tax=Setaria digitata TaxID=48799 RepID=A0A915PVM9_9BILA